MPIIILLFGYILGLFSHLTIQTSSSTEREELKATIDQQNQDIQFLLNVLNDKKENEHDNK